MRRGDPDFFDAYASGIWLYVIQTLGPILVQAGFLDDGVHRRAQEDYSRYVQDTLRLQTHSTLTVAEGYHPEGQQRAAGLVTRV